MIVSAAIALNTSLFETCSIGWRKNVVKEEIAIGFHIHIVLGFSIDVANAFISFLCFY